jgi:serine/threonine-protein kinase
LLKNIGKYEIVAEIGQGAMGIVYKARDPLIGRLVALKTITSGLSGKPELLERFYQEARSAGALQHPNIVTIFELGTEGDIPFIAMEFLEGDSLEKIVQRRDELALSKKIGFMAQICSALDYAHKHGVIHRDIKPGNIMLTKDGTVKVVDFGIARLVDTSRTQTGLMIGTPAYMSPQLLRGERADAQADIWALGVMLYELVAYQRPFLGDNPAALMWAIISQQPKPLHEVAPGCPAELEEVVGKMLEKEAPLRLQTMEDVLLELDPLYKRLQRDRLGELVAQSQQLIQNQELQRAQALLREALHLDSSNAEAKTLLDRVGAEIRRVQTEARAKEQVVKAQALFDAGRLEEAKIEAEVAVRIDTKYEPARDLAGRVKASIDRIKTIQEKLQAAKQRIAEGGLAEADQLLNDVLALDGANQQAQAMRRQIRDETARREKRKKISEGVQQARALWSQQKHLQAVEMLAALDKEFPGEAEVSELLITVRHDQAEQEKQELLAEARNLLAAQRYNDALAALESLRNAYPGDAAVRHLATLVQQEQQTKAKRQRFDEELAALRAKVSESKWDEALKRGEQLQKEFPQEFEILELVKFVRGEMQRAEQKRLTDERLKQVRGLIDAGSFAQAVKAAEKALAELPGNVDLKILLEQAQTQQKEKEKHDFLDKRIREVKARINRDELTDAIDLARQTVMTLGPDTDISQLLHAAEMELTQREKKKEQDKKFEAAQTLVGAGNFAEATRVIDQAMATQILDASDPRVQQTLRDIRETQERQQREREAEQERQREQAREQERKKKEAADKKTAAATAEKKAAEKKAAEKKSAPAAGPALKEDKGGAPSAPKTDRPGSGTPSHDYAYQSATMIQSGSSAPSELQTIEAASTTMIASGMPTPAAPAAQSARVAAAVSNATAVEIAPKPKKKKLEPVVSEVKIEPLEREPVATKVAAPLWKQPIPLAIGGVVLASVLGITIYKVSQPSTTITPAATSAPASTPTPSATNSEPAASPVAPSAPLESPTQKLQDQQQALIDQAAKEFASSNYDQAQQTLDRALHLNGPLDDKVQKLETQYKSAASDVQARKVLQQETQLWNAGTDAFNRNDMNTAKSDFQQITQLAGGTRKDDASQYLATKIPARITENQKFAEAQQLSGQTTDANSLQKAVDDLNQVITADPTRQDARNLFNGVSANVTSLKNQQAERNQFAGLVNQYNAAVGAKDVQKLEALQNDFGTLASGNGPSAGDAKNYAENLIPNAIRNATPAAPARPSLEGVSLNATILGSHQDFNGLVNQKVPQPSAYLDLPFAIQNSAVPSDVASKGAAGSTVTLRFLVDEHGKVSSGQVQAGDAGLGAAVIAAAKHNWQFSQPKIKGKAVQSIVVVTVKF